MLILFILSVLRVPGLLFVLLRANKMAQWLEALAAWKLPGGLLHQMPTPFLGKDVAECLQWFPNFMLPFRCLPFPWTERTQASHPPGCV